MPRGVGAAASTISKCDAQTASQRALGKKLAKIEPVTAAASSVRVQNLAF